MSIDVTTVIILLQTLPNKNVFHPYLIYVSSKVCNVVIVGPGAYNSAGIGNNSLRKAYMESTRKGGFGTTSVRTASMTKPNDAEVPGPSHYQVNPKPFQPRYQQPSSTFSSLTNRLNEATSSKVCYFLYGAFISVIMNFSDV